MALTLITTPGATNSNSYATVAEANTYHDSIREQADQVWSALHDGKKERLLAMATRLIDEHFVFLGYKKRSRSSITMAKIRSIKRWKIFTGFV